jgi:hypothetical protein
MVIFVTAIWMMISRKRGYKFGSNQVVRCGQGHMFSTIWIPGVSIKSIKLGGTRFQYCPVGKHWALVRPVRETELSDEETGTARLRHDIRVP